MDNVFQNNSGETNEHPPRAMLMLLVDGELATKEATQLEAHLEACWACRSKTKKIQEAIADIIDFDEQILTPRISPPQSWRNFDRKLGQLAEASGKQSLSSRLLGSLNRFLPSSYHFWSPPSLLVRSAVSVLTIAFVGALIIYFKREPSVSASELLTNAINAEALQIKAIDEAVVHQRLHVRRKARMSATEEVNWEIWSDMKNERVRNLVANGDQLIPIDLTLASTKARQGEVTGRNAINELTRVLELNHMAPQRPLSAASYQSWRNTLQHQQDQVTKMKLGDGNEALTLRTVPANSVNVGQISEASFVVRAKDWQPMELHLTVAADDGSSTYELTQIVLEVVKRSQVNPTIFAEQPIAQTNTSSPKEAVKSQPAALAVTAGTTTPTIATTDLEVEVLQLLHKAQADLGEQVSATLDEGRMLHVTGIVDTAERKAEILHALEPVVNNPAVRIDVQTVAEALARQKQRSRRSGPKTAEASGPVTEQQVDNNREAIAAAPELRRHFQSDAQVREFAARIVSQSNNAMRHVYALKRLLGQFSQNEIRTLTSDAKSKWLALVRSHAAAYQRELSIIDNELRAVFQDAGATATEGGTEITDDGALIGAVNRLFELAAASDSAVRSAFTMSSATGKGLSIGSVQFWQSMRNAESLAARIQNAHYVFVN